MALFTSTIADLKTKSLILRLFERCVSLPSSARDLQLRLNFTTWLAEAVEYHRTARMEELRLAEIFVQLVENIYGESSDTEPAQKRRRIETSEGLEIGRMLAGMRAQRVTSLHQ